jgi:hypothetical protein
LKKHCYYLPRPCLLQAWQETACKAKLNSTNILCSFFKPLEEIARSMHACLKIPRSYCCCIWLIWTQKPSDLVEKGAFVEEQEEACGTVEKCNCFHLLTDLRRGL